MVTITDKTNINYSELLKRPVEYNPEIRTTVQEIIEKVRVQGDSALRLLTKKFDGIDIDRFEVDEQTIASSRNQVGENLKAAIEIAARNIERFHAAQKVSDVEVVTMPGVSCKLVYRPLERVGLYVPGGTAPLISTVLMLGVPAKVARCNELIVCTPPPVNPIILYACSIVGAKVFTVGGAQAIAAMAFGTETIPRVDKIFGPGNSYVTEAKMQVSAMGIPIDIPAGPSELLVIADESAIPQFVAADLLSQAEHGADSQVVLISNCNSIINETLDEINKQIKNLPRMDIALKALENSYAIKVETVERAIEISNTYAPEHLILAVASPEKYETMIKNAGSVFMGNYTPESAGDYASGTNHTLPTSGFARSWGGVNLLSFTKTITYQSITPEGIQELGNCIVEIANAERLTAHANAVKLRMEKLSNQS
ncbi:MAG: histidinol dehydrogenase [Tenuifilum sp.]|uniref:histidinol dehydrogenase n=2 Tax=Tenuifilum sp. TaxID=2760880 RepID=UPI002D19ED32|nr:histidinol dehydrogenase [Tenuifilum sp.]HRU86850.1 histidinol dehydrogenase [Tenuifilum sp.]